MPLYTALDLREAQEAAGALSQRATRALATWQRSWPSTLRWFALTAALGAWCLSREAVMRKPEDGVGGVLDTASDLPLATHRRVHRLLRLQLQVRERLVTALGVSFKAVVRRRRAILAALRQGL